MKYELIATIINSGYSDLVMHHAKSAGARGGTVLHARGTGDDEIARLFGITIQPNKEIVLIISSAEGKEDIMKAVAKGAGPSTEAKGIVFSVPVDDVLGVFMPKTPVPAAEPTEETEEAEGKDGVDA